VTKSKLLFIWGQVWRQEWVGKDIKNPLEVKKCSESVLAAAPWVRMSMFKLIEFDIFGWIQL
jgi:hypothetical protein